MGTNVFEMRRGVALYRMQGDFYARDFVAAGAANQRSHEAFGVDTSVGDSSESNTFIDRDFLLSHMHDYCARRGAADAPFVTIIRQDQLQDELEIVARTLHAYGIEHKTFVGREHTDEAVAYLARRSKPVSVRALQAKAENAAAQALADAAARRDIHFWRPVGLLLQRTALASLVQLFSVFFEAPRDGVMLDMRRATVRMTSAQFADCLGTVEQGMGRIDVPMAAIVKPEDAPLLRGAVERASIAGSLLGVFTGLNADMRAIDWLREMVRVMPAGKPQIAAWSTYLNRVLKEARDKR